MLIPENTILTWKNDDMLKGELRGQKALLMEDIKTTGYQPSFTVLCLSGNRKDDEFEDSQLSYFENSWEHNRNGANS